MSSTITNENLRSAIRDVPDFPKPGIVFKDITPLLASAPLFKAAIDHLAEPFLGKGVSHVASIESRGFIFGAPVALLLGAGYVPVRKKGKLPWKTIAHDYALEYGNDTLEVHADAFPPGARVLIIDDVLATGGTAQAVCRLVDKFRAAVCGLSFVIELGFLNGRAKLEGYKTSSLIRY